jgi:putative tryptophan/tyrosine transport system substrate-binding protein
MKRRAFIGGLAGAAAWPLAARAQQGGRNARVGVLMARGLDDSLGRESLASLRQSLEALSWSEGRNLRLEVRGAGDNLDRIPMLARELVALAPDVIVTQAGAPTVAVQRETSTIPIVFFLAGDALANGYVKNVARPEGNATGVSNNFASFGGKWLDLLKDAAPEITRAALVFDPVAATFNAYFGSIEAAAERHHVAVTRIPVRNAAELQQAIVAFAAEPGGCLIQVPPPLFRDERELIHRLARDHRLPAMYSIRNDIVEGGLMSYAPDSADQYRLAASYVDRILLGTKVSDLPVQFPTRFHLVINLKTAKAMGLTIPESFLLRADEVIE